jgi:molybdopterin-guanine dinucleotide biosynthesis protein A
VVLQKAGVDVGFVVAGGKSRRMGADKALLPWEGSTLLDHAIARLRAVCDEVVVLSGSEPRYTDRGVPVVVDRDPEAGALGGVASGLEALDEGRGLFLGVDLPFVPVALLRHLLALADGWDAVVPSSPEGAEPLCAVYASACREPVGRAVREGRLKMTAFWPDVRVRAVPPEELRAFGDPSSLFRNLNTPDDYERARLKER